MKFTNEEHKDQMYVYVEKGRRSTEIFLRYNDFGDSMFLTINADEARSFIKCLENAIVEYERRKSLESDNEDKD